jgi:hypothetical protein
VYRNRYEGDTDGWYVCGFGAKSGPNHEITPHCPFRVLRSQIEQLKTERDGYVEALEVIAKWESHSTELAVDYGSNGVRDFYRTKAQQALAQSPQQVEVYRAERAVLAGAYTHWRNQTPESSNKLMDSVYELYAIDKADKGE